MQNGFFVYDGKRIFKNGDVEYPDRRINLRSDIPLKRHPFLLYHEIRPRGWIRNGDMRFIATEVDEDVFMTILRHLYGITFD